MQYNTRKLILYPLKSIQVAFQGANRCQQSNLAPTIDVAIDFAFAAATVSSGLI